MIAMTTYKFFDDDVQSVRLCRHRNKREIVLKKGVSTLIISREDVIALAKEFGLVETKRGTVVGGPRHPDVGA